MEKKTDLNVAIYARVSKDEMSSDGSMQDPENQIIPLRTFCESMGWKIRDIFVDRASGGSANRPEFQRMLSCVKQKYYDIIMVWSLDRFSREGMTNTLNYIKILKHYKTGLKSLQESWLDTSQEGVGELLLAFMSWVAEQEKRRISERTKAGLLKLKLKGKVLGRPKGWRKSQINGVKNPTYKNFKKGEGI